MRLFLSVFVCIYSGAVLACLLLHARSTVKVGYPALVSLGAGAILCLLGALFFLARPWPTENLMRRLAVLLVFFYSGVSLGAWLYKLAGPPANSVWQLVFAALSFQGAALLLVGGFLREHETGSRQAFGLRRFSGPAIVIGLVSALLFLPFGWGLQQLSSFILTHLPGLGLNPVEQQSVQTLRTAALPLERFALAFVTILLAPMAEEILFRGILYSWIKQIGFPRLALWVSSLLFALVHMNMVTFLPLLCLALVLAWLYEFTGNLLASITAHALFNALNFALLLFLSDI
jgi:membrane protease YdiL (CAAX protease family)